MTRAAAVACLIALALLTLAAPVRAFGPLPKKIIEFGWDTPDTKYARENVAVMETVPFDGIVIAPRYTTPDGQGGSLDWQTFGSKAVDPGVIEPLIEDLRATKFTRFTDNFLRMNTTPGDVDWFDDFSPVLHNCRLCARLAQQGGLKGILFDVEQYQKQLFTYGQMKYQDKSFTEYAEQARLRGREVIQAINSEFPDVTIFLTFGYELPWREMGTGFALEKASNGLLAPFLDGVIEAASEQTKIVDGWELSYGYKTRDRFLDAYGFIHNTAREMCAVPLAYQRKVQAGFGTWMDYDSGGRGGFFADEFGKNHFTPWEFHRALVSALRVSDEYVWVYTERLNWWTRDNVSDAYFQALHVAPEERRDLGRAEVVELQQWPESADFRKRNALICALPDQWDFKYDPDGRGEREKWYLPETKGWGEVSTRDQWWRQLGKGELSGHGWARTTFTVPERFRGKRIILRFSAVDEVAWVYLNGQLLYHHYDDSPEGWQMPFEIDITSKVLPDKPNVLVVHAYAEGSLGGIFRPVYLYSPRQEE